jgi:hypothetical protein
MSSVLFHLIKKWDKKRSGTKQATNHINSCEKNNLEHCVHWDKKKSQYRFNAETYTAKFKTDRKLHVLQLIHFFCFGFCWDRGGFKINAVLSIWQRFWNVVFLKAISDEQEGFHLCFTISFPQMLFSDFPLFM